MTDELFSFHSTPIGSLAKLPQLEEIDHYLDKVFATPHSARQLLMSEKTGAYVRGITAAHNIDSSNTSKIAFIILQAVVGDIPASKLSSKLSSDLQIPNDKAEQIAREIEKDLLVPIALELNQYLNTKKQVQPQSYKGASNVLNLKDSKPPLAPPPMPRRN